MDAVTNSSRTQRITAAISGASARTGVDFNYLLNQARVESGLNPDARAKTSSATGLYQFTRQTWLATLKDSGADHGLAWAASAITRDASGKYHVADPAMRSAILDLRRDPEAAAAMAAEFAADNREILSQRLGRSPEPVDLYLAHFLGAAGAARFLTAHAVDPNAPAAPLMPKAAAANHSVFYHRDGSVRSLDEIRRSFATKIDTPSAPFASPPLHSDARLRFAASVPSSPAQTGARDPVPGPAPAAMRDIIAMPSRLSLDFARGTYQRLSGLGA